MNNRVKELYAQFRDKPGIIILGENASMALKNARTLARWEDLASRNAVRLRAEHDEYYGDTDDEFVAQFGCWHVVSEYVCHKCLTMNEADAIGGCVYEDPTDPFENCYVVDLMSAAIEQYDRTTA